MALIRCRMNLAGPALLSEFTTLDAILAGVHARQTHQWKTLHTGIRHIDGIPAASIWYPLDVCRAVPIAFVRATRPSDFNSVRLWKRYDTGHYASKNLYNTYTGWVMPAIEWIVDVDDLTQFTTLLDLLPGLGKKVNCGYGHITKTTVEHLEGTWQWRDANECPVRPLPVSFREEGDVLAMMSLTLPNWSGNVEPAISPPTPAARYRTTV